jgi:pimeloyl-ACP methyl ester carboxylesterase
LPQIARLFRDGVGDTVRGMIESGAARSENIRLKTGPRLHYAEYGNPDGEPVVFLHGWPDSWFSFSRVLPLLPDSLCAVAVDQRGFGDSERPESGYAIPEMGADVIAFLDALQINRATLVGHSFGSFVARQAAIAQPQRVAALALIGTGFTASTPVTGTCRTPCAIFRIRSRWSSRVISRRAPCIDPFRPSSSSGSWPRA